MGMFNNLHFYRTFNTHVYCMLNNKTSRFVNFIVK